jgi:hypothetical protein
MSKNVSIHGYFLKPKGVRKNKCLGNTFLDYRTVPILSLVFTGNFLLPLLYLGHTTNQRSIPLGYLLNLLVQCHWSPCLYFLESSWLKKLME